MVIDHCLTSHVPVYLNVRCDGFSSPAALQEHFDKELQKQALAHRNQGDATETDGTAGANGVSDVTGEQAEGANENTEQVVKAQIPAASVFLH